MKKFKYLALAISIIFLLASLFSIRSMQNAYEEEASTRLHRIVSRIKETHPDLNIEEILEASKEAESLDLSKYGIYEEGDFIDLSQSEKRTSRAFIFLVLSLVLSYMILFFLASWEQKKDVGQMIRDLEKINKGIYDIKVNNRDEDFASLQNEMFKTSVKLREEAYNAVLIKSQLKTSLEDISHQIKTPISSIYLILESLENLEIAYEDKKDLLPYLKIEVDAITSLVLNLLNIASLESATRKYERKEIYFKELFEKVLSVIEPIRGGKRIEVLNPIEDLVYLGDPKWEKELYINLIKNAIEHSKSDLISIRTRETPTFLEISVANKSDPVAPEVRRRIFDRYYKITDKEHNFGIGLNLCKMIVEANNAKIRMEMEGDQAVFTVKYMKLGTV